MEFEKIELLAELAFKSTFLVNIIFFSLLFVNFRRKHIEKVTKRREYLWIFSGWFVLLSLIYFVSMAYCGIKNGSLWIMLLLTFIPSMLTFVLLGWGFQVNSKWLNLGAIFSGLMLLGWWVILLS